MIKKTISLALLIFETITSISKADDFGIWYSASVEYKLFKKLEVELSGSIRTFNDASRIEQSFLEGGLQYSFNKYLSAAGSYRLISKLEKNSSYYFRHKLFLDLKAGIPIGSFSISGRLRLQRTTKTYINDDEDLLARYYGRFKLKVNYDIHSFPVKPYLYTETFSPVFSDEGFKIVKYRLSAGADLHLTRKSSVDLGYIFQRDYHPRISNEHIISINYILKF